MPPLRAARHGDVMRFDDAAPPCYAMPASMPLLHAAYAMPCLMPPYAVYAAHAADADADFSLRCHVDDALLRYEVLRHCLRRCHDACRQARCCDGIVITLSHAAPFSCLMR